MSRRRGRPPHDDVLTPAEWRTLNLVRHGLTNASIAARLGITVDGVKYHVANCVQKLGLSGKRKLKSWVGAANDSVLADWRPDMTKEGGLTGLGQVSRRVSDLDAAQDWYRDMLRLTHLFTAAGMAFFDLDGVRLMLSESTDDLAGDAILYFRVADVVCEHDRLVERGVESLGAPHMIHRHDDGTEEWMAFFKDPDGRPLALMAAVSPEN